MTSKRIGVMVETEVNFFSIAPVLKVLKEKYPDLVVFTLDWQKDTMGYQQMFDGTRKLLIENGYEPKTLDEFEGQEFDLYMGPYIYGNEKIKSKCFMKYEYGTTNTKPRLTFVPGCNEWVDAMLCESVVNYEYLRIYGMTYLVDNLRFYGLKMHHEERKKKHVLFAPTYNDESEARDLAKVIRELKKEFYVVVKAHHGTNYLKQNKGKLNVLEKEADEFYTSGTNLSDLIVDADVGLFENSAAYAEAMYIGLPCAIYTKDPDYFRMDDIHSTQWQLIQEGVIPWAKKPGEVVERAKEAMSRKYIERQKKCAAWLLPKEMRTGVEGYMKVIELYLHDKTAQEYCHFHQYMVQQRIKEREDDVRKIAELEKKVTKLTDQVNIVKSENENLREIMNGGLHRMANRIYNLRRKINGKS